MEFVWKLLVYDFWSRLLYRFKQKPSFNERLLHLDARCKLHLAGNKLPQNKRAAQHLEKWSSITLCNACVEHEYMHALY